MPSLGRRFQISGGLPWMNSAPSSMGQSQAGSNWVRTRPPMRSRASQIRTARPARAKLDAAASPAMPAPITMTVGSELISLRWKAWRWFVDNPVWLLCRLLSWNLGSLLPRFGKADRDCLFATLHLASFATGTRTQRTSFLAPHCAFYALACALSVLASG